ncbi:MAG: hypothetical protein GY798_09350, partial [Hyphomicrobiales bacterium]|nr:hypothetical protein [Hyphomicrobiales bacterium]
MRAYHAPNGCFDPIGATEHRHLWHRGYPLQLLRSRDYSQSTPKPVQVDVQADFWDGDPDVDAICRMEHGPDVRFDPTSFPFSSTSVSPFNSQNTILSRDAVSHFPMLPGIGRMDDIWAAYHLQWLGFSVAYGPATVRQNRNPHDLTQNFNDEVFGYQHTASLIAAINSGTYRTEDFWPDRAQRTHEAYLRRVGA